MDKSDFDQQFFINALRESLGLDPLYNKDEYEKRHRENLGMAIISEPTRSSKKDTYG